MKSSSLFLFLLFTSAAQDEGYSLKRIRFYEGPDVDIPRDDRQYATVFPKSSSRFIWCEVEVENLLHKKREQPHMIRYEYYNPDGSLRGEMEGDFTIKSEWVVSWHQQGWGWHQPGKWPEGIYRVVVYMDDKEIGTREFTIAGDKETFRLVEIRCFEGGRTPPEKEKRSYQSTFDRNTTRYVGCEVEVQNLQHDVRDHTHKIAWKFYTDKDDLMAEIDADFTIQKVWTRAWHQSGWGWPEPGNWTPGAYRVEVFMDHKRIGQKKFLVAEEVKQ